MNRSSYVGEIYIKNNSTGQALGASTDTKVINWDDQYPGSTSGLKRRGMTIVQSATDGYIQVPVGGCYRIELFGALKGTDDGSTVKLKVYRDRGGTASDISPCVPTMDIAVANELQALSLGFHADLEADDKIYLYVWTDSAGGDTVTVTQAKLGVYGVTQSNNIL
jgi:hypothetical protein